MTYSKPDINKTKFIQLTGPSGSGKTTLLKKIAQHARSKKKSCLYIEQSLELPLRKITEALHITNHLPTISNYLACIGKSQLSENIKNNVSTQEYKLSGGEIQILKISWALIFKGIIIADEPFSALDEVTRIDVEKYIFENTKAEMIIFTSHRPFTQRCKKIDVRKCRAENKNE